MVNLKITNGEHSVLGSSGYLTYEGMSQYVDTATIICRINNNRTKNVKISLELLELTSCFSDTIKVVELPGNIILRQSFQDGPCVRNEPSVNIPSNKTLAVILSYAPGYQSKRRFTFKYSGGY